jgi:hypothetical protein
VTEYRINISFDSSKLVTDYRINISFDSSKVVRVSC